ncbi:MAG: Bpu10I family restriction endonuclease [Acidobacteria bacterium]|nr:Bpu10I family restriction endonuclease [Acidobacteriota bacterium]
MLVHGANLHQKEQHRTKYQDKRSRAYLTEIRAAYDSWHTANMALLGPYATPDNLDEEILARRVALLEAYKNFLDQQKYAECFDSRSNLHSTVLEEFLYYLFQTLVSEFGNLALIGKSHTFKDLFFAPPNYKAMLKQPHASIERKDHDFVIGVTIEARLQTKQHSERGATEQQEASADKTPIISQQECHSFDIPAVAIECKTYLDKTMLEGSSRAAEELKARNPNSIYIVVMEWLKLTEAINLRKYKVDQIYVLRKQKNTDREFRFESNYVKNPFDVKVVSHLFEAVRRYLTADWEGGIKYGLERGWLL